MVTGWKSLRSNKFIFCFTWTYLKLRKYYNFGMKNSQRAWQEVKYSSSLYIIDICHPSAPVLKKSTYIISFLLLLFSNSSIFFNSYETIHTNVHANQHWSSQKYHQSLELNYHRYTSIEMSIVQFRRFNHRPWSNRARCKCRRDTSDTPFK